MKNLLNIIAGTIFVMSIVMAAAAQDAATVDAKHYKVVLENDHVRVLRVSYGANEKSVPHQHPDSVAVALTNMQGKFVLGDGKSENRSFKAGDVRWSPAETHTPENTGGKPFEVILVELKGGAAAEKTGAAMADADDPIKVDPQRHKLEFENDRVRVLRVKAGAKEKSAMHGHPANVVIALTDAHVRSTLPDGKSEETSVKAGDVLWRGPMKHASENLMNKPFEVVIVELKGS